MPLVAIRLFSQEQIQGTLQEQSTTTKRHPRHSTETTQKHASQHQDESKRNPRTDLTTIQDASMANPKEHDYPMIKFIKI